MVMSSVSANQPYTLKLICYIRSMTKVEMPSPGTPPRGGVWGQGIEHSKPRGTGDFLKIPGCFCLLV